MNRNDVLKLMSYKEYPCISIILPTHRTAPQNKQDAIRLKNLIKETEHRLSEEFSQREVNPIVKQINSIAEEIEHNYTLDGVAIFVNKNYAGKFDLPFPVKEQLIIDETFATRDLVYTLNRSPKYWVLVLSEKPTRFYEGLRDQLIEVVNENFPAYFQKTTWDEPLRVGEITNISAYRDEKSKHFFRQIDRVLKSLNSSEPMPIAVTGVQRYLSFYNEVSENKQHIIAQLEGSYDKTSPHELAKLVWPLVSDAIEKNKLVLLNELGKAVSANKYASGIQQCWRRANEGRCHTLLVEKDFHYPAQLGDDGLTLYPAEKPDQPGVIDDAVDELIESVIQKGGKAAFVENGKLTIHQRVAAILRY
jgi:hypothetical protein